ncbi:tRNA(Met) cytidine acetyltransferase [Gilliamella sp. B2776]|uniref:GNAT family N-acetyltransferase n=1 Tax=unclassified Gilliamella TaxID=2685620 RepID=UPI00226A3402|nr:MULTISPECIES: GNAT family N-acetyltransferase [unclassified Gilliamella]MCX8650798.1 tRNA(Met) cytidine acetyltransferase [Gilliamella sp. B2779]MCX8654223.1 tRNA(Met) cytidine acetyltransferase [Gilliamella sp. B2737]MCX8657122.1 tRNA(Met) cytidine acetyltransferase [Gilliamella sp. B2894]MCX8664883.1 tRNA(Met) cytidine acetyltransferase [Gilliamella sp. B2887]MCX8692658.1 tRNA(Met) cytidine acetyltransferase [Gilliamella sp. B2776]
MSCLKSTRTLWVLQGEATQLFQQLNHTVTTNIGDWITITDQPNAPDFLPNILLPHKTKKLLGQQYLHAIFDATLGFNLDAFAMLTGTLVKGSLLILLLPDQLETWQDQDSLRWNEAEMPIIVPNFVNHLLNTLAEFDITIEKTGLSVYEHSPLPKLLDDDNQPDDLSQQQTTLQKILNSKQDINVLIGKRGRGKSALAGLFSQHNSCIVTAPNKAALNSFFAFANPHTPFFAPDELLAWQQNNFADHLIIDEAAMIPLPMLEQLLKLAKTKNSQVLLITTTEGYEGTGQGFLLKLLKKKSCQFHSLDTPIRWQTGDKLELFCDRLLLNGISEEKENPRTSNSYIRYSKLDRHNLKTLISIFYLLKSAHYQTTLVDLRRLFDAQNLSVWQATVNHILSKTHPITTKEIAAAITLKEGNLPDSLIEQVWLGMRRPKGNLVAQSLVAHAGEKLAAQLCSVRINRIAVTELYRRQHIAKKLVQAISDEANHQHIDYLSVSFAYSQPNYQFWMACGFNLVHVSSHKETRSGSYSVMAIKPLTHSGQRLVDQLRQKLARNAYWLKDIIKVPFEDMIAFDKVQQLSTQDCCELSGFCDYYRPFEASYPALCRLNLYTLKHQQCLTLPILSALINSKNNQIEIINRYHLTGKNALMQAIKQEVKTWLVNNQLNAKLKKCQ